MHDAVIAPNPGHAPTPKRPRFLWRGLLIVLPALAMAGFGLVSLRHDRILVRHQATEEAQKLATDLVESILPATLTIDLRMPGRATIRRQDDPVLAASHEGIIAWMANLSGTMVYPPPIRLPVPEPLEDRLLNQPMREGWETARRELFANEDRAAATLEEFLGYRPPERWEALAIYYLFDLALGGGRVDMALNHLEQIHQRHGSVKTESGQSLRQLAEWRWLRMGDASSTSTEVQTAALDWLCLRTVMEPGPISPMIMAGARDYAGQHPAAVNVRAWADLWDAHQRARDMAEFLNASAGTASTGPGAPGWIRFDDTDYLVRRQFDGPNVWKLAWSEEALRSQVSRMLAMLSVPAHLGCAITVGGRMICSAGNAEAPLASHVSGANGSDGKELAATIWLTDPDVLYARQRKRTWWFGSLIAVSAVSVLCGVTAAWRGFKEQQRLTEMKSNFVSSVSHEMRAPIAAVRLMAEELADQTPADPVKAGEYHGYILQECRRLSALIENVLDFSRHEQGRKQYRFEPTDLGAVVDETFHLMRSYAVDRGVALERRFEGEPCNVEVDAPAMRQVLVNLIDNAIKHSPAGAGIEVALEYPPPAPSQPTGGSPTVNGAPRVRLSVRDEGPGIPADEQRLIFQRFYRRGSELRRETQGIGLGLAIVQFITEAHGGSVRVESDVGKGSRFVVELPVTGRNRS